MATYKLTVRDGPKVSREGFDEAGAAISSMRAHAERIRAEGGLGEVSAFRTYEPAEQVRARLEISTGGILRRRDAGVDVMGDGHLVPFRGGVRRRQLEPGERSPFDAVAAALAA